MTCKGVVLGLLIAVSASLIAGCGRAEKPLDQSRAREVLEDFLTAWKDGKKIEEIQTKIKGDDPSWRGGMTLMSYEISPGETKQGGNLYLSVNRTVKDKKSRELKQTINYIVSTSPFSVTADSE